MGVIRGKITKKEAFLKLGKSARTIRRYTKSYLEQGEESLKDKRGGNNQKLTKKEELEIVKAKREGKHRSARFIRDKLSLNVSEDTVRRVLVKHHLSRISLPPVKPIKRFVAENPNDLWQIDFMGKVVFPFVGELHLITTLDDCGRFIHYGQFFYHTYKINVFMVMYEAFIKYGLPKAILSDKGSQFRAHHRHGEANYQWYAKKLGIDLIYANRAQTKGKIENLWQFIQRDFVMENLHLTSNKEINKAFWKWLEAYNFSHNHKGLNKECPADVYVPSSRRLTEEELEFILVHEESRKVLRTGYVSYYGQFYRVPDKYIGRRVWTKLKGSTLAVECGGEIIAKHKIKDFKDWMISR